MARNGKSESEPRDLDIEHELPSAEDTNEAAGDSELQKLRAERDMLLERSARLQAEFENARKRAIKEQQDFREFALSDAVKSLLPVVDSFERALHAAQGEKSELRNGIELIYRQLNDALAKMGVRSFAAKGEMFDPHLHEAVEMVDTTEAKDHEILDELQRGYKLKERLLRPAIVRVARNPQH